MKKLVIAMIAVLAVMAVWVYFGNLNSTKITDTSQLTALEKIQATSTPGFSLPSVKTLADGKVDLTGPVYFKVASAAKTGPFFQQVGFYPLDVKNGQTQTIYVAAADPVGIKSVWAKVKTNKDPVNLKFTISQGDVKQGVWLASWQVQGLSAGWYPVEITLVNNASSTASDTLWIKDSILSFIFGETAQATTYGALHCGIPIIGNATLGANCNIDSNDGVVNGVLNLNSFQMTLQPNVVFGFPGSSISLTTAGSAINIGNGASLSKTTVWVQDSDSDNYWAAQSPQSSSPGAGWESRATAGLLGGNDCNDSNNAVNPAASAWFTTSTNTDLGANTYDYNCDGTSTLRQPNLGSRSCPDQTTCPDQGKWYPTVPGCGATASSSLASSCSGTSCNLSTMAQGCH